MFASNRRLNFKNGNLQTSALGGSSSRSQSKSTANASSRETANMIGGFFGSGGHGGVGNSNMNVHVQGGLNPAGLLRGMVNENEDSLRYYYRDIYFYDAVCGASADVYASFPFGNFTLMGSTPERLEKYEESLARINTKTLLPEIQLARLVDGAFVGSLVYNKVEKVLMDILIYQLSDCNIQSNPFYSTESEIVVRNNESVRKFINSDSPSARAFLAKIPKELKEALSGSAFKLDGLTTLFVPRKTIPGEPYTSFFKRVLPIYILEKTLFRGTIVESNKRQRSMLHVTMGDDTHEFTPEEMAETVNQFQLADLDPLGAVIGTRNNVAATEIRQGGDFWKWTDTIDILTPYKLRALGFSEALLSGDANYSNVESAYSVFMELCDMARSELVYEVFTNKIFPTIAVSNEFYKEGKRVDTTRRSDAQYQLNNYQDLDIPTIKFEKELTARREESLMDTLEKLEEKGMPITLRTWCAAGNVSYESLLQDAEKGAKEAESLKRLKEQVAPNEELSNVLKALSTANSEKLSPSNLLKRKFKEEDSEISKVSKTGSKQYVPNQRQASSKMHDMIIRASRQLDKRKTK